MSKRGIILLSLFLIAIVCSIVFSAFQQDLSMSELSFEIFFGALFFLIAFLFYVAYGKSSEGYLFLPRSALVATASLSAAFASMILISLIMMPLIGMDIFKFMFRDWAWLILPILALIYYPLVKKRLI